MAASSDVPPTLKELRDQLESTYANMQTTIQSSSSSSSSSSSFSSSALQNQAIQACTAAFSVTINACMQRIMFIANDPKVITSITEPNDNGMDALGKLTWQLLRIAPFLGDPMQASMVSRICGAPVERLDFDKRLRTEEHCTMLFLNVCNHLSYRHQQRQQGADTTQVDAILQSFCPPLMVFLGKNLPLLAKLRADNSIVSTSLRDMKKAISMIRRFMLQSVDETILCVYVGVPPLTSQTSSAADTSNNDDTVKKDLKGEDEENNMVGQNEKEKESESEKGTADTATETSSNSKINDNKRKNASGATIRFAQRVKFSGLCVNRDLARWATSSTSGLPEFFQEAGSCIEMDSWTAFRDNNGFHSVESPHRIYQEGIPDDIAPFVDDERIAVFRRGPTERLFPGGKVFPIIDMEATLVGEPLSDGELKDLESKIQSAPTKSIVSALKHQFGRGGQDNAIQKAVKCIEDPDSLHFGLNNLNLC